MQSLATSSRTARFLSTLLVPASLAALASGLGGCKDPELIGFQEPEPPAAPVLTPDIGTYPTDYDFGQVRLGDAGRVDVQVGNIGDGVLTVGTVSVVGADPDAFVITADPASGQTFDPNSSRPLSLEFRPGEARGYQAAIEISSDDPDENPYRMPLKGEGIVVSEPVAVCSVIPATVHIGTEDATFVGHDSYDPEGAPIAAYSWQLSARPTGSAVLMPGCFSQADCGPFVPDVEGLYEATLTVIGRNGQSDACTVTLEAIPTPQGPVARCDVTPVSVQPPFEPATFVGSASRDPAGRPLTYAWRLQSAPQGSAAALPASCNSAADCGPFVADLAGTYVGELTVSNDAGLSDVCTATLEAIPSEDLWVEMYWTFPNDDMDLHLLGPGGTFKGPGDCYYLNCEGGGLDWGVAGNPADNPALDLDDIIGTGPENINIAAPAAGTYRVIVHDFPLSSYTGPNNVTLKVHINGQLVYTDQRTVTGEDSQTPFCTIDWPAGTVTRL